MGREQKRGGPGKRQKSIDCDSSGLKKKANKRGWVGGSRGAKHNKKKKPVKKRLATVPGGCFPRAAKENFTFTKRRATIKSNKSRIIWGKGQEGAWAWKRLVSGTVGAPTKTKFNSKKAVENQREAKARVTPGEGEGELESGQGGKQSKNGRRGGNRQHTGGGGGG